MNLLTFKLIETQQDIINVTVSKKNHVTLLDLTIDVVHTEKKGRYLFGG